MQHPLWAKIWSPEKVDLGGYDLVLDLHNSGPKFTNLFHRMRDESW